MVVTIVNKVLKTIKVKIVPSFPTASCVATITINVFGKLSTANIGRIVGRAIRGRWLEEKCRM